MEVSAGHADVGVVMVRPLLLDDQDLGAAVGRLDRRAAAGAAEADDDDVGLLVPALAAGGLGGKRRSACESGQGGGARARLQERAPSEAFGVGGFCHLNISGSACRMG